MTSEPAASSATNRPPGTDAEQCNTCALQDLVVGFDAGDMIHVGQFDGGTFQFGRPFQCTWQGRRSEFH
jgi:hypothetical protein